jgi:glutathione synthase/RimK-type ligase-like ATP-grasp enzyme
MSLSHNGITQTMPESPASHGKIAILYDRKATLSPSNPRAIEKFIEAAKKHGYDAEIVRHYDFYRLYEFDILFIRETTALNNDVHNMAKLANRLGLVVIDDPNSIEICCDKAKQFKLFAFHNIPIPYTFVVNRKNISEPNEYIERPYILKNPYSSFSYGVFKVNSTLQYEWFAKSMLEKLDKIIVQEFIKTDFDWRIGILDNQIIFACKYYMTPGHWKTIKHNSKGDYVEGDSINVPINEVPSIVAENALRASFAVGKGLYGIDIKEINGGVYIIEINDNPNIDSGIEDTLDGDKIYDKIITHLISLHCLKDHGL